MRTRNWNAKYFSSIGYLILSMVFIVGTSSREIIKEKTASMFLWLRNILWKRCLQNRNWTKKIVNKYGTSNLNIVFILHVVMCLLDIVLYLTEVKMYFYCICLFIYSSALNEF